MYTKCPACRAEISFEAPKNIADLPQGYRHRLRCPNCGVTIKVKLPDAPVDATSAPTYTTVTTAPIPVQEEPGTLKATEYTPDPEFNAENLEDLQTSAKPKKKAGRPRSIAMMIFSLLFIAISILAYVGVKIPFVGDYSTYVNPIAGFEVLIRDFAAFKALFAGGMENIALAISVLLPMLIFVLAGIIFIIDLIGCIIGKYGKTFNMIFAIIILIATIAFFIWPFLVALIGQKTQGALGDYTIMVHFKTLIGQATELSADTVSHMKSFISLDTANYVYIALPAIGLIQFVCAIIFCAKSLKAKTE